MTSIPPFPHALVRAVGRKRQDAGRALRRELADYRTPAEWTDLELLVEQSGQAGAAEVLGTLQRQARARLHGRG